MKDQDEGRKALAALWGGNAEFYGMKLTAIQLKLFVEKTEHLGPRLVKKALDSLQMDPEQRFMPRPADVVSEIKKNISATTSQDATGIAQEIYRVAMSDGLSRTKFLGRLPVCDESGKVTHYLDEKEVNERKAKKRLSEEAWNFVERSGGWFRIASSIGECDYNQLNWIAQTREALKAFIRGSEEKLLDKLSGNERMTLDELNNLNLGKFSPNLIA